MVEKTVYTNGVIVYTVVQGDLKLEQSYTPLGKIINVERCHHDYTETIPPGGTPEVRSLFIELHNWKIANGEYSYSY